MFDTPKWQKSMLCYAISATQKQSLEPDKKTKTFLYVHSFAFHKT